LSGAVSYLEKSLTLVGADSTGYEEANKELETWKTELAKLTEEQKAAQAAAAEKAKTTDTSQTNDIKDNSELTKPETTVGNEEKVNIPAEQLETPVVPTGVTMPTE